MMFAARLDEIGKPAWIGLMIVSFIMFWPFGLVILGYLIGSGRMGCWTHADGGDRWQRRMDRMHRGMERMQRGMERMQAAADRWSGPRPATATAGPSSGNRAFDEYRDETLRRLEDEQRAFREFLERLRHAKDKAEFDQFMADRHGRPDYQGGESGPRP
jgi:hypothetical protein